MTVVVVCGMISGFHVAYFPAAGVRPSAMGSAGRDVVC